MSAFSPPESCIIFCSFFPGGCDIITIPASRISSPSTSSIVPRPPPKSSLNTLSNSFLISSNFCANWTRMPLSSSSITCVSELSASMRSSSWPFKKIYRSFTSLYSSIALTFTSPRFLMAVLRECISFFNDERLSNSGFLSSNA